jgi:hypothetical protein
MKNKIFVLFISLLVSFSAHTMELELSQKRNPREEENVLHIPILQEQKSLSDLFHDEHKELFNAIIGSKKNKVDQYLIENPNLDEMVLKNAELLARRIHSAKLNSDSCTPCWKLSSSQKSALFNMLTLKAIGFINYFAIGDEDLMIPALLIPSLLYSYNAFLLFSNWHEWRASIQASDVQELLIKKLLDLEKDESDQRE